MQASSYIQEQYSATDMVRITAEWYDLCEKYSFDLNKQIQSEFGTIIPGTETIFVCPKAMRSIPEEVQKLCHSLFENVRDEQTDVDVVVRSVIRKFVLELRN